MISMVQPLHVGNALRVFVEPPANAVLWRVYRKASNTFTGMDDPSALLVHEGTDRIFVDSQFLQNEAMAFYRPWYSADGGVTWTAGNGNSGTPRPTYADYSTDVLGILRDRLESGLRVECERGNFVTELGYIQVYTAPPSLERDLRMPLVTVHMESEEPEHRAIGENITGDENDMVGVDWSHSEGWLARVNITVIGWSLNSDERIELRKATRRLLIANLAVFAQQGMEQVSVSQQDVDAVNGEYPAQIYQAMTTFSCVAPVLVGGIGLEDQIIQQVNTGVING
jgi:hypothetical protein